MSWHFLVKLEGHEKRGRDAKVLNLDVVAWRGGHRITKVLVWRDGRDDFPVPSGNGNNMSVGTIIGIVVAVLFTVLLVLSILWWKGCLIPTDTLEQDLKGLRQHTALFTLRQIRAATNNFDPANKIGEGGFGPVYKGLLSNRTAIAVKQLSSKSKQGNREFINEIGMISALRHPHLVNFSTILLYPNRYTARSS
ncbi:unnamed protein product [Fraxinus pennsylvanica]|uniref:Protein kinase domain-containing protein n=1 Tax=Fraxinus pennsylvanica TaxID=56036 RepID=A0AAD2AA60_9LAMI|nr:unnamed protein product [Fraxinus pennsylvanica]